MNRPINSYAENLRSTLMILLLALCVYTNAEADPLSDKIKQVERLLHASIGVAVHDLATNDLWAYNGETRFPLMSTFKPLACAKLLMDVAQGSQQMESSVTLSPNSLVVWSPVTEKHLGEKFTLRQACRASLRMSDNTAANIVLNHIGGPRGLTQFMRSIGDDVTRLDRYEPELGEAALGDKRDTTTPIAIVESLNRILFGNVLEESSAAQLKQWMVKNEVADSLLRSMLPKGWSIADRSGAGSNGSRGIVAVVWSDHRSPIIIGIYLTQTEALFEQRNRAIAEIGEQIFDSYGID